MFVLTRPAVVEFVVFQVAPECRRIGRFRVAGHAGRNRVRFKGRVGHRRLGPGTYRIRARPLSGGRAVLDMHLVVVTRANKREIAAARKADACARFVPFSSFSAVSTAPGAQATRSSSTTQDGRTDKPSGSMERRHGVLGARFSWAQPGTSRWLLALLGPAIALLAIAALPLRIAPNRRTAEVLARSRGVMALTGAGALVGVGVAYLL